MQQRAALLALAEACLGWVDAGDCFLASGGVTCCLYLSCMKYYVPPLQGSSVRPISCGEDQNLAWRSRSQQCLAMVAGAPSSHVSAAFCCIVFAICLSCNSLHRTLDRQAVHGSRARAWVLDCQADADAVDRILLVTIRCKSPGEETQRLQLDISSAKCSLTTRVGAPASAYDLLAAY
jgi:hypothetical protein